MREIHIAKTFASKSVLVTGATGFVGKVLVEKLLRSCSEIDKVYILLRDKKGHGADRRFDDYKNLIVFDNLRDSHPNALEKLEIIQGDLTDERLSDDDFAKLKSNVSFVFHCAAAVNFEESLTDAIKTNVMGTRNILNFAEQFEKLEAFVHVSTAYSNTNQGKIMEKIYKPIFDYNVAIEYVEMGKDKEIKCLDKLAMKTYPNTYIFTKNLTEQLVSDRSAKIPIVIVRPSIISPSSQEPYPGWCDTFNGASGILAIKTAGTLRSFYGNGNKNVDLIPCDFTANSIIAAAASIADCENKDLVIYNCTSGKRAAITWNRLFDLGCESYKDFPSTKVFWFPGGRSFSSFIAFFIYFLLFQLLPAILLDILMLITGNKMWAVKLQRKIFASSIALRYFTHTSWEWDVTNFEILHRIITLEEKNIFNFDISLFDYREYMRRWMSGVRKFLLKLDEKSLPAAKRKYQVLSAIDKIIRYTFYFFLFSKFFNYYFAEKNSEEAV